VQPIWASFRIASFDSTDPSVEVSGEVQFDATLNDPPARRNLFGGQAEGLTAHVAACSRRAPMGNVIQIWE